MTKISVLPLLTSLLFVAACASLPKDAPEDLVKAQSQLDLADDLDSEDYFPRSIDLAESLFDESVDVYDSSVESGSPEQLSQALTLARRSHEASSGANALTANMRQGDTDITVLEGEYSIPELLARIEALNVEVAEASKVSIVAPVAPVTTTTPFAMTQDFAIEAPVAFFPVGKDTLSMRDTTRIREIARSVSVNPRLLVTVTGFADHRGSANINQQLSDSRAEAVARVLREAGVSSSNVTVVGAGATGAAMSQDAGDLQLDRKVVLGISFSR